MSDAGRDPAPDADLGTAPAPAPAPAPRLRLSDPLEGTAAEDRPESWGERARTDAERLADYEAQRPPHHGG